MGTKGGREGGDKEEYSQNEGGGEQGGVGRAEQRGRGDKVRLTQRRVSRKRMETEQGGGVPV